MITVVQKELDIKEQKEFWNFYNLDDKSILKIKSILISVYDAGNDQKGNPIINLQTVNVVGVKQPNEQVEPLTEIKDIEATEQKDNLWNEYVLENDLILMMKPSIAQVDRTTTLDPRGIPIYNVQSQVTVKYKT